MNLKTLTTCVYLELNALCMFLNTKQKRRKWDKKSISGKLVAYAEELKVYRFWMSHKNKVEQSRDVQLLKMKF